MFPSGPAPDALHALYCPALPGAAGGPPIRFALLPADAEALPAAFAALRDLAARIHRDRRGDALQLIPERVRFRDEVRDAVAVFAAHPVSGETRLIGHAWIDGGDWRVLQAALEAITPAQAVA